ncbi:MAG: hypothetical protein IPN24_13155 [Betaproteobacteria bacterium]|nr:hypothetical protein [Betaproteobacteria bacterium]
MLNKLIALLALAGLAVVVGGCNTIEGAGKDIRRAAPPSRNPPTRREVLIRWSRSAS